LWMNQIYLCNPEQILQKLQRKQDFFIMEWLITSGVLTTADEICFNHCCLAYQAMTMTDVMTGNGTKVTKQALELSRLSRASSKWDWPNECPFNKDILQWWKGLCIITSENVSLPFSLCLERWIEPSHLNWQWFYHRWDWSLYHVLNNTCHIYQPFSPHSKVAYRWVEILTSLLVPSHELERTTVRYERGQILFEGSASNSYSVETVHDSIYDFIAQWDDSWPLANCFFPEDPEEGIFFRNKSTRFRNSIGIWNFCVFKLSFLLARHSKIPFRYSFMNIITICLLIITIWKPCGNTVILLITGYDLGWLSVSPWCCCCPCHCCSLHLAGTHKLMRIILGAAGSAHHDRNKHRFLLPNTSTPYGHSWSLR
jgi:hypothetical protein